MEEGSEWVKECMDEGVDDVGVDSGILKGLEGETRGKERWSHAVYGCI